MQKPREIVLTFSEGKQHRAPATRDAVLESISKLDHRVRRGFMCNSLLNVSSNCAHTMISYRKQTGKTTNIYVYILTKGGFDAAG